MKFKEEPLFWGAISFAVGIILGYYLNILYIFMITFVFIPILFLKLTSKNFKIIFSLFVILLVGFSWVNWQQYKYTSSLSIANWNGGGEKTVSGEVFENLSSLEGSKIYVKPYRIKSSSVKYGLIQLDKHYIKENLKNGQLIKVKMILRKPVKQRNPGGFSYYNYLKKQGIYSLGELQGNITFMGKKKRFFKNNLIRLKHKLINLFNITFKKPYNQIIKGLILGERAKIPVGWNSEFTRAGANHLLAISGLHIGFILIMLIGLFSVLGFPPVIKNCLITLFILTYIFITGCRASVFRAGLLSILFLWAPAFNRKGNLFNLLGMTAFLNLIKNPFSLFTVGFQLTYIVLLFIVLWNNIFSKFTFNVIAVSLAAQLGSIPLTSYYFNQIHPVGILTNLWAIPLVGFIVFIGFCGLIVGLINPVLAIGPAKLIEFLFKCVDIGMSLMIKIPFSQIELPSPSPLLLIIIYVYLLLLSFILKKKYIPFNIKKRKSRLFKLIFIGCFIFSLNLVLPFFHNNLGLIFFSVGQGDSIFMDLPSNQYVIVDGGGFAGRDLNKGETVVMPFLKHKGIKKIDLVFVTHFDADHALGITSLLKNRDIGLLLLPLNFKRNKLAQKIIKIAQLKNIPIELVKKGDKFRIDDVVLSVLNPGKEKLSYSSNRNSIVLKVRYHEFSTLLTGDLNIEGEKAIIDDNLKSVILKVGHHGSDTSSSKEFLKRVQAREAIISVGKNNFGHPVPKVLNRLKKVKSRIWRTDKKGAVIVQTDGYQYTIHGFL